MKNYKPEGNVTGKFNGFKRETIESFLRDGVIVEAPAVKCDGELNLYIDLGPDIYGVIPYSEFEYSISGNTPKSIAVINRVAKFTCFKVVSIEDDTEGKTRVNLSRKAAQQECYENYIKTLKVGQVIDAKMTHAESYGAFCDIGCGITALLPIENFCIVRVNDPKKTLRKFKNLKAIVKSIDENGRIILTHKELLGTWEQEAAKFKAGDVVVGTVRLIEKYGIFVELTPNLAGLAEKIDDVHEGDVVSVFIRSIIPDKMKVKLSIIDTDSAATPFVKLDYRVPKDKMVNHWVYSTESANKLIETKIK